MAGYEIRIAHQLDDEVRGAFEGLSLAGDGDITRLSGDFDQAALHGLLERVRALGYELIDARRVRGSAKGRAS
jgi:hypothetical protein